MENSNESSIPVQPESSDLGGMTKTAKRCVLSLDPFGRKPVNLAIVPMHQRHSSFSSRETHSIFIKT